MHHSPTVFIKRRRSVRRYRPDPVPESIIRDILDCARLAPTARNRQPWLIGATNDKNLLSNLAKIAETGRFIEQCSVCFSVFTLSDEKYFLEDGVAATMNILTTASAHELGACWIAGDKKEYAAEVRDLLDVPPEYTLISLVAAGYPAQEPAPYKRSLEEVTFWNRYTNDSDSAVLKDSNEKSSVSPLSTIRRKVRKLLLKYF